MLEFIQGYHPIIQALFATIFTWFMTALGAAGVFFNKKLNKTVLDCMLGFAAGVMIAASYWSLLAPSIEMSEQGNVPVWIPPSVGFLLGGIFLYVIDKILPHLHLGLSIDKAEGIKTTWQRSILLVLAITLHNIPEGLAVGVAFGAVAANIPSASLPAAVALAIGIGIQNFPEGFAVSMPLRGEGMSKFKSFWYGQLSAVVEPVAGVIGAAFVLIAQPVLPYALAFAAGAMIYVVIEELIPSSQSRNDTDLVTMSTMGGFVIMMILDVSLG
ncbi:MAG TPA: ZIP family metal transporter [Ignavibacteriaceae bacterium]|nr:ZIP family metal transporter [Ignavibacteriaceae bacterium]